MCVECRGSCTLSRGWVVLCGRKETTSRCWCYCITVVFGSWSTVVPGQYPCTVLCLIIMLCVIFSRCKWRYARPAEYLGNPRTGVKLTGGKMAGLEDMTRLCQIGSFFYHQNKRLVTYSSLGQILWKIRHGKCTLKIPRKNIVGTVWWSCKQ